MIGSLKNCGVNHETLQLCLHYHPLIESYYLIIPIMACQPSNYAEEALYKKNEKFEHQIDDIERHKYEVDEPHNYNLYLELYIFFQ